MSIVATYEEGIFLAIGYSAEEPADEERHTYLRTPVNELVSYYQFYTVIIFKTAPNADVYDIQFGVVF